MIDAWLIWSKSQGYQEGQGYQESQGYQEGVFYDPCDLWDRSSAVQCLQFRTTLFLQRSLPQTKNWIKFKQKTKTRTKVFPRKVLGMVGLHNSPGPSSSWWSDLTTLLFGTKMTKYEIWALKALLCNCNSDTLDAPSQVDHYHCRLLVGLL